MPNKSKQGTQGSQKQPRQGQSTGEQGGYGNTSRNAGTHHGSGQGIQMDFGKTSEGDSKSGRSSGMNERDENDEM